MTQKMLDDLIKAHNILYSFPVSGPMVTPMASVLITLQGIINEVSPELKDIGNEDDVESIE